MLYSNITDDLLLLEKQMKTRLNKDAMGEPLDAWVTGPEGPKTAVPRHPFQSCHSATPRQILAPYFPPNPLSLPTTPP